MPFTDPMADGPSIQLAGQRALKAGMTVDKTFDMVRRFRKETGDNDTPILLMGYYNLVYQRGPEKFCKEAAAAGVDGFILVDLPPEEADELKPYAAATGLDTVLLTAPTTDDKRLPAVLKYSSGFVYFVSVLGITGTKSATRGGRAHPCRAHQPPHQAAGRRGLRHPHARAGGRRRAPRRCRRRRHRHRRPREGGPRRQGQAPSPTSCRASSPTSRRWPTACAACARPRPSRSACVVVEQQVGDVGLVLRSQPKVEVWPWPGTKVMSSPSGHSRLRIEFRSWSWLPRGKSVRPIEPRNSTSPTKAILAGLFTNTTWPGVWPGQCTTSKREVAEAHRLAVRQPAVGHERLVDREIVLRARVRQALDQEQVVLVRALDLRRRSARPWCRRPRRGRHGRGSAAPW